MIKFRYINGFAVFALLYVLLSLAPILSGRGAEIFPFFSFKLYSRIPQDFAHYDLLLNDDYARPKFLLHQNSELNGIQKKAYNRSIREVVEKLMASNLVSPNIEIDGHRGQLVLLTGDYCATYQTQALKTTAFSRFQN